MNGLLECMCTDAIRTTVDMSATCLQKVFSLRCGLLYFKQTQVATHVTLNLRSFQSCITTDLLSFSQPGGWCV